MRPSLHHARRGNPVALWTRLALTALVSAVMFAMMMLTTADVTGRYLFNSPVPGSFEIVQFLLAIVIFSALPLITWDEKHITVNLLERFIPEIARRWLDAFLSLVSTVVVAVVTERMWIQGDLMAEGQHITGFLEWPIAPIAYFMSVMSALATILLALLTWQKFTGSAAAPSGGGATDSGDE